MILSSGSGRGRKSTAAADPGDAEAYRLVGIEPARAPAGYTGRDWLIYKIAQGVNVITGYRQGDLRAEKAEVEKIVIGLNERRVTSKGRPGPKPKATPSTAAPAAAADADEGAS